MPPSIHTSPSRPLTAFGGLLTENARGERLCPIRSRINTVMRSGPRVTICAPLAISGYAHRTPLERSCVEGIHGLHSNPERNFPKLRFCEAFIEGSSVAESSWTALLWRRKPMRDGRLTGLPSLAPFFVESESEWR